MDPKGIFQAALNETLATQRHKRVRHGNTAIPERQTQLQLLTPDNVLDRQSLTQLLTTGLRPRRLTELVFD